MQSLCTIFPSAHNRTRHPSHRWLRIGIGLVATTTLMAYSQSGQQQAPSAIAGQADQPVLTADANHPPEANYPLVPVDPQPKLQISDNPSDVLRRRLANESAKLVQLAVELKWAVDRSNQGTLSLHVVRTADSVAKLAHGVKEEMKHAPAQH